MGASPADVELLRREEREFTISDGTRCTAGWSATRRRAGRARCCWTSTVARTTRGTAPDPVHRYHQELAARGWTVLLLNPRASDGYGEAFYKRRDRRVGRL